MNPISKYTTITITIILILTSIHVLMLPAEAMMGGHIDPVVLLAQKDAIRDMGHDGDLRWFAYGAGCWTFAVIHASINNPTVPSQRLLGKSPEHVNTYTDTYKRSTKIRRMEMSAIGWGASLGTMFWLWNTFRD